MYLCVILDLFSRKIVGWSLSENMKTEMVSSALRMAVMRRRPKTELLFHSDRGSQYASEDFRKNLGSYKITQSMSAAGRCYDNAFAESFFHSFKTERVFGRQFYSRVEARKEVFEYLEIYYNRSRLHSSLGYLTPVEFEEKIKQAA